VNLVRSQGNNGQVALFAYSLSSAQLKGYEDGQSNYPPFGNRNRIS